MDELHSITDDDNRKRRNIFLPPDSSKAIIFRAKGYIFRAQVKLKHISRAP